MVRQMLLGALEASGADIGVSVSGIAGPNGGSDDKRFRFDRQDQSCASALRHLLDMKMEHRNVYSAIAEDNGVYNDSVMLVMRGL